MRLVIYLCRITNALHTYSILKQQQKYAKLVARLLTVKCVIALQLDFFLCLTRLQMKMAWTRTT